MTRHKFRKRLQTRLNGSNGEAIGFVIIAVLLMAYLVIPLFSAIIEKQIMQLKATEIRDSIQISALATYDSLSSSNLSQTTISFDSTETNTIFTKYIVLNMHLNSDLTPKTTGCIAEGKVIISSVAIYATSLPLTCPDGTLIKKPSVHTHIIVPIKPTLYRGTILQLLGVDTINCQFHYDTEIVLDN